MMRAHTLASLLALAGCATTPIVPDRVQRGRQLETRVDAGHATLRLVGPSGSIETTGSFPAGAGAALRWTPREPGRWRWSIYEDRDGLQIPVDEGFVEVEPGPAAPFVRLDPREPHSLMYADGRRFIPIGENRINIYDPSWNWELMDEAEYVAHMARAGMNTLRIFLTMDCEREVPDPASPPACLEPRLGVFDETYARRIDRVFEAAEKNGIHVIVTLFAIGFTPNETWKSWEDNPYAALVGGVAASPAELFRDLGARAAAKRRLAYVLARWGASPSFLAIDLLNEPEWDGPVGEATWLPWARDLGAWWKREDPYGHLVTVGPVGLHWNVEGDERAWYASPENDIVQWHLYGKEYYEPTALAAEMTRKVRETWGFNKPVLCGEFGYGGEDQFTHEHTHAGLWSAVFSGAGALIHSAPPFNLDSDGFMTPTRARRVRSLRGFLAQLPPTGPLVPVDAGEARGARLWQLAHGDDRAVWLLAPPEDATSNGVELRLTGLKDAAYRIAWWDDTAGAERFVEVKGAEGGTLTITAPSFARHLAASITRVQP